MKHKTNPEEFEQRKAEMAAESDRFEEKVGGGAGKPRKRPDWKAVVSHWHKTPRANQILK